MNALEKSLEYCEKSKSGEIYKPSEHVYRRNYHNNSVFTDEEQEQISEYNTHYLLGRVYKASGQYFGKDKPEQKLSDFRKALEHLESSYRFKENGCKTSDKFNEIFHKSLGFDEDTINWLEKQIRLLDGKKTSFDGGSYYRKSYLKDIKPPFNTRKYERNKIRDKSRSRSRSYKNAKK